MARLTGNPNFAEYLTVGEAAEVLGVSRATLRNWDRTGKLKPRRHPQNGYRIYLHEDLQAVLSSAEMSMLGDTPLAPRVDWSQMGDSEHFVQFYESDEFLIASVSEYVHAALSQGNASVVIATLDHRLALQRRLVAHGVDIAEAIEAGRYIVLDASDTLSKLMVGQAPDAERFNETIGTVISQLAEGGRRVRAFGEMVALLWNEGRRDAAIRLEALWNELGKRHRFALFCAYPISGFGDVDDDVPFHDVCGCHSRVIPAESYSAVDTVDQRLRAISLLQQKAQSLAAEIAHRTEVDMALSKRERELSDFFENATEGLHMVGPAGTILWANQADYELLGYSAAEYVGHSIADFHADADVIADMLHKLLQGETLKDCPARLRCKNGSIRHVLISSNACFEDGRFAYTRCFTRDVTQQRHAEHALAEESRRKDEFLATLSHELRNPLAPISNALEMLRPGRRREETIEDARRVIERQVQQLTRLVDDLRDLSRITRDQIELRKERVDVAEIIKSAVEMSRPLIDSAGHLLTLELPQPPLFVEADPARLAQVFSNLLNNAAKYTEPGGKIHVRAERSPGGIVVSVRDNGVGIACDALAHVFDIFRQENHSLEWSQGGLGVGLTLVRRFVELHGGTVHALSEGLGKGSEFVVQLPAAPANRRSAPAADEATPSKLPKQRILVVDDNRDACYTMSMLLRLQGHDVRTAHNGLEAVEIVAEFEPKIILMDVGMPKLNGYEATRRIRQMPAGKDAFIVALTGWGQTSDKQQSAEAGCSAHLVKPVDFATLERLLANGASTL